MNILIIQQLLWGVRIGHPVARVLHGRGHKLSALVHGLETYRFLQGQRDLAYDYLWLADPVYDEGTDRVSPDAIREVEARYGLDSVWRVIAADRILAFSFRSGRRFTYRKAKDNDYLLSVLLRAYGKVREMLETTRAECVIAPNVASLMNYLLYLEARHQNIPFYTIGFSRFGRTFFIGDNQHMTSTAVRSRFEQLRERPETSDRYADAAHLYDKMLRDDREVKPSYLPSGASRSHWRRARDRARATALLPLRLARAAVRPRRVFAIKNIWLPNNSRMSLLRGVLTNYREEFGKTDHQGACIRDAGDIRSEFVFYPLQLEPEMTLMMWAPQFANQLEVCRRIAMALPAGVRLVVKEHPNMVSSRRRSYYGKLRGLLNVELMHSSVPASDLFRHPGCRGVVVINSTAGFEAAVVGVPVVMLGPAEYDVLPAVQRAGTYEEATAVLRRICSEPRRAPSEEVRRASLAYIAALLEHGFEADYQELWTRGVGTVHPPSVADAIERRLSEHRWSGP